MGCHLLLPPYAFVADYPRLLGQLSQGDDADPVQVDFKRLKYYTPGAIVALVAKGHAWQAEGRRISLLNHEDSDPFNYFRRIDFLKHLGFPEPRAGVSRATSPDFVELLKVEGMTNLQIQNAARRMTTCVCPTYATADLSELIEYATGEIVLNCVQHSHGTGFLSAQYMPARDLAQLAIGDCGRGILASFRDSRSPHYREGMSDLQSLHLALTPGVSCSTHIRHPYHGQVNFGRGLKMLREIVRQTLGYMFLASGRAYYLVDGRAFQRFGELPGGGAFQGTLCYVAFRRSEIVDYNDMLADARNATTPALKKSDGLDTLFR